MIALALAAVALAQAPATPVAQLRVVSASTVETRLAYTVRNPSGSPYWLVSGSRMPYVTVRSTHAVELHFDVADVGGSIYGFEAPALVRLAPHSERSVRLVLRKPVRPSDHFSSAGAPVAVAPRVRIVVVQAFGRPRFRFDPADYGIYRHFLAWQRRIRSNSVVG
jgi:hypothetical protein